MSAHVYSAKTFAALGVRNFRLYFIGQLISVSGTWMQSVALGWLVLQTTGSSLDLGYVVALQFVPMVLAGPYGGLVADRRAKRQILYVTQSVSGVLALGLGLLVSLHDVSMVALYIMAALLGLVNLFDNPARQSFVQEMVGPELIANAVRLNSVLMNGGRLIGPGIAAGFIAVFGSAVCFYVNAASYIAVLVALVMMRGAEFLPMRTVSRDKGQVRLGLRYVASQPLLREVLIAIAAIGTFAYNFTVSLPLLARTTFHARSAADYGVLMAAMGLGAIIGGLATAYRSRPTPRLLTGLVLGFGVFMALVGSMPTLTGTEIVLIPTGALSIALISTANSFLQTNSSQEMRGRVMSLYAVAFLGTTPIGAPLIGLVIDHSNPRAGVWLGAAVTLITGVFLVRTALVQRTLIPGESAAYH
ncbi:MAG: MFS transporter [Acidimicrobiaceae bacterium]|nr:MFS transporter [Acidimicrobiaceae bacterium]